MTYKCKFRVCIVRFISIITRTWVRVPKCPPREIRMSRNNLSFFLFFCSSDTYENLFSARYYLIFTRVGNLSMYLLESICKYFLIIINSGRCEKVVVALFSDWCCIEIFVRNVWGCRIVSYNKNLFWLVSKITWRLSIYLHHL